MKKTILEIYALTVCFVTVICFIVALGIGFYSLVQISNPSFTLDSWQYNQHQTNDSFWNTGSTYPMPMGGEEKKKERPPESELTKQRLESYERVVEVEQHSGFQMLVKVMIVIFINITVFYAHWRIGKHARSEANS